MRNINPFCWLALWITFQAELDKIVSLLEKKVRKRLYKTAITSFDQLLHNYWEVERSLKEFVVKSEVYKSLESHQKPIKRKAFCVDGFQRNYRGSAFDRRKLAGKKQRSIYERNYENCRTNLSRAVGFKTRTRIP